MRLQPLFTTEDLRRIFQISERTARRRMVVLKDRELKRSRSGKSINNSGGSRPYLIAANDVLFFGLTQAEVDVYIDGQLNTSLFSLMDESDAKKILEGKWVRRHIRYEGSDGKEFCIKRMCYFSIDGDDCQIHSDMKRIGVTVIPVELFTLISGEDFKELFRKILLITRLSEVLRHPDLTFELVGYLSRMTGRSYPVADIVLIDEVETGGNDNQEEVIVGLLKRLAKKIDRNRSLVFLSDSYLPDPPELSLVQTGFQKLEGSHFYISGSIEKFKAVRFKISHGSYGA